MVWRFARVVPSASHGVQIEWLLKRNCSMSPAQLFAVYLSMCAVGFDRATVTVFQTLASKRRTGPSGLPLDRAGLYT